MALYMVYMTDILDLGYIPPANGRIRDFLPLEHALTVRTTLGLVAK